MNVASLELCRELYELSGWQVTDDWWRVHLLNPDFNHPVSKEQMINDNIRFKANTEPNNRFREENKFYPAYDLGYLLRKLPASHKLWSYEGAIWYASSMGPQLNADTPEDAVCKLAIELFKQKVLIK